MARIDIEAGPMFKKILTVDFAQLVDDLMNALMKGMLRVLKRYTPVNKYVMSQSLHSMIASQSAWSSPSNEDEGNLKQSYRLKLQKKLVKSIESTMDWWIYLVRGHRVLTTEKSRRWFFGVFLKKYPNFKRKTLGGAGYVPPNPFPRYALHEFVNSGEIPRIVKQHLKKLG